MCYPVSLQGFGRNDAGSGFRGWSYISGIWVKTDNGIVAVIAYAVFSGMTFPLTFDIYKPRERLKTGDKYLTKPAIAAKMIRKLKKLGFKFNLVLADSLYS